MRQRTCMRAAGVPGEVAQRVQHGVGWSGARSAAAGRRGSGPGRGRRRGRCPSARSRRGLRGGQPVPVVEQAGADADRDGQPAGRHVRAEHAGVGRRRGDAEVRRRAAGGEEAGAVGERAQQVGQLGAVAGDDVEGDERGVRWRSVDDAGLVRRRGTRRSVGVAVLAPLGSRWRPASAAAADRRRGTGEEAAPPQVARSLTSSSVRGWRRPARAVRTAALTSASMRS